MVLWGCGKLRGWTSCEVLCSTSSQPDKKLYVCVCSKWCWSGLLWSNESPRCICECIPWAAWCSLTTIWTSPVELLELPRQNTSCTVGSCQVSSRDSEALADSTLFIVIIVIVVVSCWWPSQLLRTFAVIVVISSSSSRSSGRHAVNSAHWWQACITLH